jgi:hypothetical protein
MKKWKNDSVLLKGSVEDDIKENYSTHPQVKNIWE